MYRDLEEPVLFVGCWFLVRWTTDVRIRVLKDSEVSLHTSFVPVPWCDDLAVNGPITLRMQAIFTIKGDYYVKFVAFPGDRGQLV